MKICLRQPKTSLTTFFVMSLVRDGGASCSLSPKEFCCRHSHASDYSTTASQHFLSRYTTTTFIHPAQLHGIICAIPRHVRCYSKRKQTRVLHYARYQVVFDCFHTQLAACFARRREPAFRVRP